MNQEQLTMLVRNSEIRDQRTLPRVVWIAALYKSGISRPQRLCGGANGYIRYRYMLGDELMLSGNPCYATFEEAREAAWRQNAARMDRWYQTIAECEWNIERMRRHYATERVRASMLIECQPVPRRHRSRSTEVQS